MEKTLRCPNCGEQFEIDEKGYQSIVKQIRDKEFQSEIEKQKKLLSLEKDSALALVKKELSSMHEKDIHRLAATFW